MAHASAPPVLGYGQQPRRWLTRAQRIFAAIAVGLILVNIVLAALPPWWTQRLDVCTECGSMQTQRASWFGFHRTSTLRPTSLENWILAHAGVHAHDWQFVGETDSTGLRACGRAPASMDVRAFDDWIATTADADVAALVIALRDPDELVREAAVERFGKLVFGM